MKTLIRKLIHYLGNVLRFFQMTFLRASGAKIGKNTMISLGAKIDVRRGKITIGDHCLITHGCYILSHDGAAHVIDANDNGTGYVTIGNHVFIGVNSVVMRNVTIGNHAIIGAGSVVNKDIPEGAIAAGNPVKIIKQLEPPYQPLPKVHKDLS
ncbi:acyltransferase [Winogradskyella aquimaris]|uniref:Acyltransferase n=1 Tax=Winogradskyella aquimaris TaxID=864074 RepID=A0ABU5ELB9_9FLAO|nr:acyltransferase [Winogradskyella aquimaris]MDY2587078.1 acyltransferase [Winogradskyella aquimaris]